jgi:hypothetical protein
MKNSQIFKGTLKFCWAKLGLQLGTLLADVLLFLLLVVLLGFKVFGNGAAVGVLLLVWYVLVQAINFALKNYLTYMLKAGHVAVMEYAVTNGSLPENQFQYGFDKVKSRFVSANVFWGLDKAVAAAVKQLQKGVDTIGNLIKKMPGGNFIVIFLNLFVDAALNCVDECCLAWIFHNEGQGAFKSACDGIVIYFQNVKHLLKTALKTTVVALLALVVVVAIPVIGLLAASNHPIIFLFILWVAFKFVAAVKTTFVDSYILASMLTEFTRVAPETELSVDLYGKLSKLSKKFKEMWERAGKEEGGVATA